MVEHSFLWCNAFATLFAYNAVSIPPYNHAT